MGNEILLKAMKIPQMGNEIADMGKRSEFDYITSRYKNE
jgi:hypothetical protein